MIAISLIAAITEALASSRSQLAFSALVSSHAACLVGVRGLGEGEGEGWVRAARVARVARVAKVVRVLGLL